MLTMEIRYENYVNWNGFMDVEFPVPSKDYITKINSGRRMHV